RRRASTRTWRRCARPRTRSRRISGSTTTAPWPRRERLPVDEQLGLLADVKIVAFTTFLIGPAATQYLADMGADVIKVEEPHRGPHERHWSGAGTFLGDESVFFLMSNRNVRSVGLDLKHPRGRQAALDLCKEADVVVTNFRPG